MTHLVVSQQTLCAHGLCAGRAEEGDELCAVLLAVDRLVGRTHSLHVTPFHVRQRDDLVTFRQAKLQVNLQCKQPRLKFLFRALIPGRRY